METFTVTRAQLIEQLAEGSATSEHGDHQIWLDPSMAIITEDGPRSASQTAWFVAENKWIDEDKLAHACDMDTCILTDHIADTTPKVVASDEELLDLVQRTTTSLKDLYLRGRAKGLLKVTSSGYGNSN